MSPTVTGEGNNFLAIPAKTERGDVYVYDAVNMRGVIVLPAHDSALRQLAFNSDGSLLATVCVKGTVIKVFSMPDGANLFEFRRSLAREAIIFSMCFSSSSKYLCVSGNTPTIHIFRLQRPAAAPAEDEGITRWLVDKVVPTAVKNFFVPVRACRGRGLPVCFLTLAA